MKSLPSILAAVFLVAVLVLYMCTFQVRSTEVAIIKTFGQADPEPIEVAEGDPSFFAGLHIKWPWPIQSVAKYDKRIRLLEDRIEETPTRDSKQIIVTTYTGWRISDPYKFHTQYQDVKAGEAALRARIRTYKKAIIGVHDFSDLVSTDPGDRKLNEIEAEMRDEVASVARDQFGIDIVMFGIKKLTLPQSVTEQVFKTMKSAQETKAQAYKAEGQAEAQRIEAEATQARERILAVVSHKVAEIESEGQAEVGRIYKQFRAHPELRIFLDELRALEEMIRTRTTIFMDTDMVPMNLWDSDKRMLPIDSSTALLKKDGSPASVTHED